VKTLTLEDLRTQPQLREQLVQAARRHRTEAIGRLLGRLAHVLKPRLAARRALLTDPGLTCR